MAASDGPVVVPSESPSSCFKRDDFMKASFSVDAFVSTYKGLVSLDVLKHDLEEYLKSLKHALIELINQDYADFVNLSTNLVGMDKSINNLSVPLGQLKEEVLLIRTELDETIGSIGGKLDARSQLRQKKICMQHLLNITKSLEKIERLLHGSLSDEPTSIGNESDDESHLIERVASEFNQLQFYVTQSQGHPLVENIKSRISAITLTLQKKLETAFQEGIQSGQFDLLSRVLRTYAIIDKIKDAEMLFRDVVVKPYMNEVICEQMLLADPVGGLKDIYNKVLEFIPAFCAHMIKITSGRLEDSNQGEQRTAIRGYDFIVNAVWPEVVELIEGRLPSIFAPGNPDAFHKRYTTSMWFVERFESLCPSQNSVKRLRNHKSFSSFMSHWSLPVYFQIRFQEIAGRLEIALNSPNVEVEGLFKTTVADVLWWGLETCWLNSVYIKALCHRFWKLTLQIISRVTQWLSSEMLSSSQDGNTTKPQTSYYVHLFSDVNSLSYQVPKLFKEKIEPVIISTGLQDHITVFADALEESLNKLKEVVPAVEDTIIQHVVKKSSTGLDAARNIPRLYRRTNKEIPNKASPFVAMVTKPLQDFQQEYKDLVPEEQFQSWSTKVFQTIFERYSTITSDVLTSIKKTEDSLLRLKKTRKGAAVTSSQEPQGTFSDDDKIRLQFSLDVEEFRKMIKELKVQDSCPAFLELALMVQNARSGSNGQ